MGFKTLELTLISANDIKNVSMMGKMDVYVVVSISGDPESKQKTPTHEGGGTSPCWNHTLYFNFDEGTAVYSDWEVVFILRHDAFGPDKDIGEVRVPIKELVSTYQGKWDAEFATYQVKSRSSGNPKGELKVSYKLKDTVEQQADAYEGSSRDAAYAYAPPPPPADAAYGYPPAAAPGYPPAAAPGYPPAHYGGGYPQQPVQGGYGYPPQQQGGYGYPQQQGGYESQQKSGGGGSGLAMGLGVGLVGGVVGGLVINEMLDGGDDDDGGDEE